MSLRLRWTHLAIKDLRALRAYIAEDDPKAAQRMAQRIRQAVEQLREHPGLGRPGRVMGTRELVVNGTPYLVPYRVRGHTVHVLRVYHGARRWPTRM